jgi:hypothetical protein
MPNVVQLSPNSTFDDDLNKIVADRVDTTLNNFNNVIRSLNSSEPLHPSEELPSNSNRLTNKQDVVDQISLGLSLIDTTVYNHLLILNDTKDAFRGAFQDLYDVFQQQQYQFNAILKKSSFDDLKSTLSTTSTSSLLSTSPFLSLSTVTTSLFPKKSILRSLFSQSLPPSLKSMIFSSNSNSNKKQQFSNEQAVQYNLIFDSTSVMLPFSTYIMDIYDQFLSLPMLLSTSTRQDVVNNLVINAYRLFYTKTRYFPTKTASSDPLTTDTVLPLLTNGITRYLRGVYQQQIPTPHVSQSQLAADSMFFKLVVDFSEMSTSTATREVFSLTTLQHLGFFYTRSFLSPVFYKNLENSTSFVPVPFAQQNTMSLDVLELNQFQNQQNKSNHLDLPKHPLDLRNMAYSSLISTPLAQVKIYTIPFQFNIVLKPIPQPDSDLVIFTPEPQFSTPILSTTFKAATPRLTPRVQVQLQQYLNQSQLIRLDFSDSYSLSIYTSMNNVVPIQSADPALNNVRPRMNQFPLLIPVILSPITLNTIDLGHSDALIVTNDTNTSGGGENGENYQGFDKIERNANSDFNFRKLHHQIFTSTSNHTSPFQSQLTPPPSPTFNPSQSTLYDNRQYTFTRDIKQMNTDRSYQSLHLIIATLQSLNLFTPFNYPQYTPSSVYDESKCQFNTRIDDPQTCTIVLTNVFPHQSITTSSQWLSTTSTHWNSLNSWLSGDLSEPLIGAASAQASLLSISTNSFKFPSETTDINKVVMENVNEDGNPSGIGDIQQFQGDLKESNYEMLNAALNGTNGLGQGIISFLPNLQSHMSPNMNITHKLFDFDGIYYFDGKTKEMNLLANWNQTSDLYYQPDPVGENRQTFFETQGMKKVRNFGQKIETAENVQNVENLAQSSTLFSTQEIPWFSRPSNIAQFNSSYHSRQQIYTPNIQCQQLSTSTKNNKHAQQWSPTGCKLLGMTPLHIMCYCQGSTPIRLFTRPMNNTFAQGTVYIPIAIIVLAIIAIVLFYKRDLILTKQAFLYAAMKWQSNALQLHNYPYLLMTYGLNYAKSIAEADHGVVHQVIHAAQTNGQLELNESHGIINHNVFNQNNNNNYNNPNTLNSNNTNNSVNKSIQLQVVNEQQQTNGADKSKPSPTFNPKNPNNTNNITNNSKNQDNILSQYIIRPSTGGSSSSAVSNGSQSTSTNVNNSKPSPSTTPIMTGNKGSSSKPSPQLKDNTVNNTRLNKISDLSQSFTLNQQNAQVQQKNGTVSQQNGYNYAGTDTQQQQSITKVVTSQLCFQCGSSLRSQRHLFGFTYNLSTSVVDIGQMVVEKLSNLTNYLFFGLINNDIDYFDSEDNDTNSSNSFTSNLQIQKRQSLLSKGPKRCWHCHFINALNNYHSLFRLIYQQANNQNSIPLTLSVIIFTLTVFSILALPAAILNSVGIYFTIFITTAVATILPLIC